MVENSKQVKWKNNTSEDNADAAKRLSGNTLKRLVLSDSLHKPQHIQRNHGEEQ
jgi:hypothetical protein